MVRALPRFTRIESCNYLFTKQLTKTEKMAIGKSFEKYLKGSWLVAFYGVL